MPSITALRINGKPVSAAEPSLVLPRGFAVSWEADSSFSGFEIRVGESSTGWGTSSFTGNIANLSSPLLASAEEQIRFASGLTRARTYFGQVRLLGGGDWFKFSTLVKDSPFIFLARYAYDPISDPVSLTINTKLSLDIETSSEAVQFKTEWFNNGSRISALDGSSVLPLSYLRFGDKWNARVVPYDSMEEGTPFVLDVLTVQTIATVSADVQVIPPSPTPDDILVASYSEGSFADVDPAAVKFGHRWFVNGEQVLPSADSSEQYIYERWARLRLQQGDTVSVQVQPFAAGVPGTPVVSSSVTVGAQSRSREPILVDGRGEDSISSSSSPVISWRSYASGINGASEDMVTLMVGRRPLDSSIISRTVRDSDGTFQIPEDLLSDGLTYYVTLENADGSNSESVRFSTPGHAWSSNARNIHGWRLALATSCTKIDAEGSSVLYPYAIECVDDTYAVAVDISPLSIRFRCGSRSIFSGQYDFSYIRNLEIAVKGTRATLRIDGQDIFDGNFSEYAVGGVASHLQISPRTRESANYELAIASVLFSSTFDNSSSLSPVFEGRLPLASAIALSSSAAGFAVVGREGGSSSDTVFFVETAKGSRLYDCAPTAGQDSGIHAISSDSTSSYCIAAHPYGATIISGCEPDDWNLSARVTSISDMNDSGFSAVSSHGVEPFVFGNQLTIDTGFAKLGKQAGNEQSGTFVALKIDARIGIDLYEFSVSGSVLSADLESDFDGSFLQRFSIDLVGISCATLSQRLSSLNIGVDGQSNPFSSYYSVTLFTGFEDFEAGQILAFAPTTSSPISLEVNAASVSLGSSPMGSASGRKAFIETSRGSTEWSQANLSDGGYTVDCSFSLDVIEESLAPDAVEEAGIGLSIFDGSAKHSINVESGVAVFDSIPVLPLELGQSVDFRIAKRDSTARLFFKPSDSATWSGPIYSDGSTDAFVSGSCFEPRIASSASGDAMVAVWWSDDGGSNPVSWLSHWGASYGWSDPIRLGNMPSSKHPSIVFDTDGNVFHVVLQTVDGSSRSVGHLTVSVAGESAVFGGFSRVAFIESQDSQTSCTIDDAGTLHVFWTDSRSGKSEIYHSSLAVGEGWKTPFQVTATERGASSPACAYSSGGVFVAFVNSKSGGASSISMSKYAISNSRWDSSGAGLADIAVSSSVLSFAAKSPSIAVANGGILHVAWDDFAVVAGRAGSDRVIMYRPLSPSGGTSGNIAVIAQVPGKDCTNPFVSCPANPAAVVMSYIRKSSPPAGGLTGVRLEQTSDVSTMYMAYRGSDQVAGTWGPVVLHRPVVPTSAREMYEPCMVNGSSTYAHIIYGFTPLSLKDRSQREFADSRTVGYARIDLGFSSIPEPFIALGSVSDSVDDVQLATVREPFIRLGDMSSFRSCRLSVSRLKAHIGDACIPREITFVGSASSPLPAERPVDVDIGTSGDAFIISAGRIFHYDWQSESLFDMSSEGARSLTHLPEPPEAMSTCDFDFDGNMISLSRSGQLYGSIDLFRFVRFDFGGSVSQVARDGDGVVFVKDGRAYRVRNWRKYIAQIPVSHSESAIVIENADIEEIASIGSLRLYPSSIFGLVAWGKTGVFVIRGNSVSGLGSQGDLSAQAVVSVVDGPDGNLYCATGSLVYRLDGSRWSPLRAISPQGAPAALGNISSLSVLGSRLMVACGRGVFEGSVDGGDISGSLISNQSLYVVLPSINSGTSSYRFRAPPQTPIGEDTVTQAVINGHPVNVGFGVSPANADGERIVQFACPLLPEDKVSIAIRDDMRLIRRLKPNPAETIATGAIDRTLGVVADGGTSFFASASDSRDSIVKISTSAGLPSDEVILDTIPPRGELTFVRALNANRVRLSIQQKVDANDANGTTYLPFDATSGIDTYTVSNYPNFTSNGTDPLAALPFTTQFDHSLLSLSTLSNEIHEEQNGAISSFASFRAAGSLAANDFLFLSEPASVRRKVGDFYSESAAFIGPNPQTAVVRDVIVFQGMMYAAVARADSSESVTVYRSSDGSFWEDAFTLNAADFAGFFISSYDNALYMLTHSPARLYSYRGLAAPSVKVGFLSDFGTGITGYDRFLYISLGEDRKIVRVDLAASPSVVETMHVDADNLTSAGHVGTNVYVGTESSGRILRSPDEDEPFLDSWRSMPSSIPYISSLSIDGTDLVVAAIGKKIFKYSNGWSLVGTAQEDVVGVSLNSQGEVVFWSADKLYSAVIGAVIRRVYLRLTDRAGNSSNLSYEPPETDDDGDLLDDDFVLDIPTSALRTITSYGQLIEVDEGGNLSLFLGNGDAPFFSADRVAEEYAVVETEILNASEGHVAWGMMTWIATVPPGSEVNFFVKTGRTRQECADATYGSSISSLVNEYDLSALSGQFIQVKIELRSELRTANPLVRQLSIESILSSTSQLLTTVFVLPSPPKRGIISMDKMLPTSASIIPCIDTLSSLSVADFQEVPENRLFSVDSRQYGNQLRVGFKFLTPTGVVQDGGSVPDGSSYSNIVLWTQVNETSADDVVDFRVSFYDDPERTQLRASATTVASPEYFLLNGLAFPGSGGALIPANSSATVAMIPYGFDLVAGTTYYVEVTAIRIAGSERLFDLDKPFVKDPSVSFFDKVVFEFVNSGDASSYDFRIRFFEDEALTVLAGSYFSLADSDGWEVRQPPSESFDAWPSVGSPFVENGGSIDVSFMPTQGSLTINKKYYVTIESFDGVVFSMRYAGLTFMSVSESGFSCGDQSGVPILKGFSIMFELEGGELVRFNSLMS